MWSQVDSSLPTVETLELQIDPTYVQDMQRQPFYQVLPAIFPYLVNVRVVISNHVVRKELRRVFTRPNLSDLVSVKFFETRDQMVSSMLPSGSFYGRHGSYRKYPK